MRGMLGTLIGRPVLEAVLGLAAWVRRRALGDLEGRHHQFRTNPIDVVEGAGAERWLSLPDVRRTVPDLPGTPSLRHMHPQGVRRADASGPDRVEARTLVALLDKAQDLRTRKFVTWLRREVIFPAERRASMRGRR
jgi:hypothetical protein